MDGSLPFQLFGFVSLGISMALFGWRLRKFNLLTRPLDRATPKGSVPKGVIYAFSLGMAPWAKESTRRHWAAYLRGVAFHLGIFLGLAIFVVSSWLLSLPFAWRFGLALACGAGAILGVIGFLLRFVDHNLRMLSQPDDYFAVAIVSLFLAVTALWLIVPSTLPFYYLASGSLFIYAPFSKIRHCIYFAYSRLFFGKWIGSRAVLPHAQSLKGKGNTCATPSASMR